jgi:hypothetical protein
MKRNISVIVTFVLTVSPAAFAQVPTPPGPKRDVFVYRSVDGGVKKETAPVVGAPYSATMTTESVQTLGDGNRIVMKSTGFIARDSQGRTRQQVELPSIGNVSPDNMPQMIVIQDPVGQVAYMLNMTDKTAVRMPATPGGSGGAGIAVGGATVIGGPLPPLPPFAGGPSKDVIFTQRIGGPGDSTPATSTELGSQSFEGVPATGTRSTVEIPEGRIGNERPISIVTEVWYSPELKTIVYSKRSDPRLGDQTFQLTDLQRVEPDPSLFIVPPEFTIVSGPAQIFYKAK